MLRHSVARASCALILVGSAVHGHAVPYNSDAVSANVDVGFDLGVDRAHQEFDGSSADLTTVTFAPHVSYDAWELSLNLPWQHAEGGYFVNNQFPVRAEYLCQNLSNVTTAFLQRHPRIAALNQTCQNTGVNGSIDNSVSGLSDATLFLRYAMPLDSDGIWLLSMGGGYKFDNGDSDKNLGSGTRNTLLEASLSASYGWFVGSATAGYAWVSATDAAQTKASYSYGMVDAGIHPLDWLTLGATWSSDESYYSGGETVRKTTAYVRVKPLDHVGVKVYASDYGSTEGYPNREYGASLYLMY